MAGPRCSVGDERHPEERGWLYCLPFSYLCHKHHHTLYRGSDLGGLRASSYLADFRRLGSLRQINLTSIELHGIIFVGVNLSWHLGDKPWVQRVHAHVLHNQVSCNLIRIISFIISFLVFRAQTFQTILSDRSWARIFASLIPLNRRLFMARRLASAKYQVVYIIVRYSSPYPLSQELSPAPFGLGYLDLKAGGHSPTYSLLQRAHSYQEIIHHHSPQTHLRQLAYPGSRCSLRLSLLGR